MILQVVKHTKKNRKVKAIILFGSHAKGKATPISDVDICIIGNKLSEMEKSKLEALGNEKMQINFFDELPLPV
ncbi:MAG: nucleotidyltransferase domain-containing protein [Candidatus Aenigmatarchaeota archaeon]